MRKEFIVSFIENQLKQIEMEKDIEIKTLQLEIDRLKNELSKKELEYKKNMTDQHIEHQNDLKKATLIRWSEDGKYYNIKDFCFVGRHIFFIKATELKQWLYQQGILDKINDKYIPNENSDICKLIDNELYIQYSFIRNKIVFLRSLIFMGDIENINEIVKTYKDNKDMVIEQMANTVYVECKQRSEEFKEYKENKYFVESKEKESIR